jgi:glycosyltransferase involved in cell wall biosynthesis
MKILFIAKRHYMRHDAPLNQYGRLYYLPYELSRIDDNQVLCVSLDYRHGFKKVGFNQGQLTWKSLKISPTRPLSLLCLIKRLLKIAQDYNPDVIIASSDLFNIALGCYIAKLINCVYISDLYDNYESFGMAKIPFAKYLYRSSLKKSDAITCISNVLANEVQKKVNKECRVIAIETTIDKDLFYPGDKITARTSLGLPMDACLIGVAGSLGQAHGITTLYKAFDLLSESNQKLALVLAGTPDKQTPIPEHKGVHYLGSIPNEQVVTFYQAMDVAVIPIRDSEFGRYSFPQKTYEILACRIPVVVTDVGAMKRLFKDYPQCLWTEGDPQSLAEKIYNMIMSPVIPDIKIPSWKDQAIILNNIIKHMH